MPKNLDILLFGGAFDPPHLGHATVIKQVLEQAYAKEVIIMPVGQHAFAKNMTPAQDRLEMTKRNFAELTVSKTVNISEYELAKEGTTYSYQTLKHFQQKYPHKKLGWLIGSDNVSSFSRWRNYQEMLEEFVVYVYPRQKFAVTAGDLLPGMVYLENVLEVACASREIREQIAQGASYQQLENCLSKSVWDYIQTKKLYTTKT